MDFLDNKKILFVVAGVVLVLAIATAGAFYWQWDGKQKIQQVAEEKCVENFEKMTDEQLIERINKVESSENINKKAVKYLSCNFNNSNKSEETYQRTRILLGKLGLYEERLTEILKNLEEKYSSFKKGNTVLFSDSWIGMLAAGDLTDICPDRLSGVCVKTILPSLDKIFSSTDLEREVVWCNSVCNLISQYSENKNKLEKEVVGFKEWSVDPVVQEGQYRTRYALAYRFGGEEAALKVCNNVADVSVTGGKECVSELNNLLSNIDKINMALKECTNSTQEFRDLICSVTE